MNRIISDTAEYGCYLFNNSCIPLLTDFMTRVEKNHIGSKNSASYDKKELDIYDSSTKNHSIEKICKILRNNMKNMKKLA